ncbi:Kinesin-like protein kif1b [Nowakowskiella sp. JEL0407]|nr:Kinesin-like protein kif1b [Nowakowskiella sp. JEL0407]
MSAIKVSVRIRPFTSAEASRHEDSILSQSSPTSLSISSPNNHADIKHFSIDHCYWSGLKNNTLEDPSIEFTPKNSSQLDVFNDLGTELLSHSIMGYNTCIFAYGQTGSGKSFTMMGDTHPSENVGLIPRICSALFQNLSQNANGETNEDIPIPSKYSVSISYYEIYNERVFDLLSSSSTSQSLKIREHPSLGPYIVDLAALVVDSVDSILRLLEIGNKRRSTAGTNMNEKSSRSHAVFTIVLTQEFTSANGTSGTSRKVSKISLVDLAGSERANATGATGVRLKEGGSINKSLAALGNVIYALGENSEKSGGVAANPKRLSKKNSLSNLKNKLVHVPYRDSVLTYLLKDSLGGSSKTYMIATLSPSPIHYEETLSTLRFVDRVKKVINNSKINEIKTVEEIVKSLKEEVKKLKDKLLEYEHNHGGPAVDDPGNNANPSNNNNRKSLDPPAYNHARRNSRPDSGGFSGFGKGRSQADSPIPPEEEEPARSVSPADSVAALLDQLSASEKLIAELNESFEEKLRKTHQFYLEKFDHMSATDAVNLRSITPPEVDGWTTESTNTTQNQHPTSPYTPAHLKSFSDSEMFINLPPPSTTATSEDFEFNKDMFQNQRRRRSRINSGDYTLIEGDAIDFQIKKSQFLENLRDVNSEQRLPSSSTFGRPFGQIRQNNNGNQRLQQKSSVIFQTQPPNQDFVTSAYPADSRNEESSQQQPTRFLFQNQQQSQQPQPPFPRLYKSKSISGRNNRLTRSKSQIYHQRKNLKYFSQPFASVQISPRAQISQQQVQKQLLVQPDADDFITPTPALLSAISKWRSRNVVSQTQKLLKDISVMIKEANIISLELKSKVMYVPVVLHEPVPVSFWEGVTVKEMFSNVFGKLKNHVNGSNSGSSKIPQHVDRIEIYIKLLDARNNSVYYWTTEELLTRLENMRKLYNYVDSPNEFLKQRQLSSQSQNVFYSNANSTPHFELVGVASVLLKNILWGQSREFKVPVFSAEDGKIECFISVVVTPISTLIVESGSEEEDIGENGGNSDSNEEDGEKGKWEDTKSEGIGLELFSELIFEVTILEIIGVDESEYTQIHGQFRIFDEQNHVERVYSTDPVSDFKSGGILKFGYCQSIKLNVTERVQRLVKCGFLKVEVFGRRKKRVDVLIEEEMNRGLAVKRHNTNELETFTNESITSSSQEPNKTNDAKRKKYDFVFQMQMHELSNTTGTFKFVPVQSLTPQINSKNVTELLPPNNSSSSNLANVKSYLDTGTFLIRQGLQRKITIKIFQVSEDSEDQSILNLISISAIRLGNIRRIDEGYITAEANRFSTANETESLGNGVMINIPIFESRVYTLQDGRSILEIGFPWDSSVHNSPFLNQVTKQQSRIDVTVELDLKITSPNTTSSVFSSPDSVIPQSNPKLITTQVTQNTSFIIFDRDFKLKPIMRSGLLKLLLAKHINGRTVKYSSYKSFLYRVEVDFVYKRNLLRPVWEDIDRRWDYIRGEEILNGWQVKGQDLILEFLEKRRKMRWRDEVEIWRQRVEEDDLVPNERGDLSMLGLPETKHNGADVPDIVVLRGTPSPNFLLAEEDEDSKNESVLLLKKITELWRHPSVEDFGFVSLNLKSFAILTFYSENFTFNAKQRDSFIASLPERPSVKERVAKLPRSEHKQMGSKMVRHTSAIFLNQHLDNILQREYTFALYTKKFSILLQAQNSAEMNEWLPAFDPLRFRNNTI